MPELSIKDAAAVNRLAAVLAPHVTNGVIDAVAKQFDFKRLEGSNKMKKIQWIVGELLEDGRSRTTAAKAIATLAMEAHHRTVAGTAAMTTADADAIVAEMKALGLSTGDLARTNWRAGLKRAVTTNDAVSDARTSAPTTQLRTKPQRHEEALRYISQLLSDSGHPQDRGRELEKIVLGVLAAESLQPTGNIVNAGEQIDLAFVLDGQHYLVECKWEKHPIGLPDVSLFSVKVGRKAEGTFGVLLSMSGFAHNINTTAARGARLNCIGVTFREFMDVLEGRRTFADVVRAARAAASTRSEFLST